MSASVAASHWSAFKLEILALLRAFGRLLVHEAESARVKLYVASPAERLRPLRHGLGKAAAARVELLQEREVDLVGQVLGGVLPLRDLLLVGTLLVDESDGIDTFVHSDGVFPVVGALCELRVVFYPHRLAGPHVAQHHFLLHATHLLPWVVLAVAHLLDAIA